VSEGVSDDDDDDDEEEEEVSNSYYTIDEIDTLSDEDGE
jgi:hypothetical protein